MSEESNNPKSALANASIILVFKSPLVFGFSTINYIVLIKSLIVLSSIISISDLSSIS